MDSGLIFEEDAIIFCYKETKCEGMDIDLLYHALNTIINR